MRTISKNMRLCRLWRIILAAATVSARPLRPTSLPPFMNLKANGTGYGIDVAPPPPSSLILSEPIVNVDRPEPIAGCTNEEVLGPDNVYIQVKYLLWKNQDLTVGPGRCSNRLSCYFGTIIIWCNHDKVNNKTITPTQINGAMHILEKKCPNFAGTIYGRNSHSDPGFSVTVKVSDWFRHPESMFWPRGDCRDNEMPHNNGLQYDWPWQHEEHEAPGGLPVGSPPRE